MFPENAAKRIQNTLKTEVAQKLQTGLHSQRFKQLGNFEEIQKHEVFGYRWCNGWCAAWLN